MSELIDLWSVQEPISYEYYLKEKVLRFYPHTEYPLDMDISALSSEELFDSPHYVMCREEYDFMRKHMSLRLKNYKGNYPVWAWTERPPLPEWGGISGLKHYCFHIRVPKERVLVSSFDAWCCIYGNKDYVALCEEEYNAFDKWREVSNSLPDREQQREIIREVIRKTWRRIFEVDLLADYDYWTPVQLQAVIEEVYEDEVIEIEQFISVSALDDDDEEEDEL